LLDYDAVSTFITFNITDGVQGKKFSFVLSSHDEWVPEMNIALLSETEMANPKRLANPSPNRSSKSNNIVDHSFVLEHLYTASSDATPVPKRTTTRKTAQIHEETSNDETVIESSSETVESTREKSRTKRYGYVPVATKQKFTNVLEERFKETLERSIEKTLLDDAFLRLLKEPK
jgi:hypothetical protein